MSAPHSQYAPPVTPGWRMRTLPGMDDAQFAQWVNLLESRTGMCLPVERKSFLLTSLAIRMREIGCADYPSYYHLLTATAAGAVEWSVLVDRLTVHETRFFRHEPSLRLLRDKVLPRAGHITSPLALNVWSVGCASGEEAYTLAMIIDDYLAAQQVEYYLGVSGTDISLAALAAARRGVYTRRKLAGVPPAFIERYFTPLDREHYQVRPELRARVCFTQMNVAALPDVAMGGMDIIFCQNVLIYFNGARRVEILNAMARNLKPGGVLILGPGEIMHWRHPEMEPLRYDSSLAYRKRMPAEPAAAAPRRAVAPAAAVPLPEYTP